jgi:hypothetical protein
MNHFILLAAAPPEVIILPVELDGEEYASRIDNPQVLKEVEWFHDNKPKGVVVHLM